MSGARVESEVLLSLALDLTRSLGAHDRARRVLEAVRAVLPCDAASILLLEGDALRPLATHGLAPAVAGMRFDLPAFPRLAFALQADGPAHLGPEHGPDPFDGLLATDSSALAEVHACLGCPLAVDGRVVGLLTADALEPGVFRSIQPSVLDWLSALAGAALSTMRLVDNLERAAERLGQALRTQDGREEPSADRMVGQGPAMQRLREDISLAARTDATVLIEGESGTGKELVARAIHERSERAAGRLVLLNCAALPDAMAESELFGHVQGAFTDARSERRGRWQLADGGTLFLDEVGELSLGMQAKLLRALQEGEVQRVGADEPVAVDARIVAATNRNLVDMVEQGRFRFDLFHRLNVWPIRVPPLRERAEDVAALMGAFGQETERRLGTGPVRFTPEALRWAERQRFDGNVRELENLVFRVILRTSSRLGPGEPVRIGPEELAHEFTPLPSRGRVPEASSSDAAGLADRVAELERSLIREAVDAAEGNWSQAAQALGLDRSNLLRKARRLGLRD